MHSVESVVFLSLYWFHPHVYQTYNNVSMPVPLISLLSILFHGVVIIFRCLITLFVIVELYRIDISREFTMLKKTVYE